jgi:hypothetical protein
VSSTPLRRTTRALAAANETRPSETFGSHSDGIDRSVSAATAVRRLVDQLAPLLGLDSSAIDVRLEGGTGGVDGRSGSGLIVLSGAVDPADRVSRGVIAHELAHARQHLNHSRGAPPDVTRAEAEAAGIATALAEGRPLWRPRQVLPGGHIARRDGASGVAPEAPSASNDRAGTTSIDSLESALATDIEAYHQADIRTIEQTLDHPWTETTEGMIENCLRLLARLQFVVARSLVRSLGKEARLHLAHLNDQHHQQFPDAAVAVLAALSSDELKLLDAYTVTPSGREGGAATRAIHGVDPSRLSSVARRALLGVLRRFPTGTLVELEKGDRRATFRSLLQSVPDASTDETELRTALTEEAQRHRAEATPDEVVVDRLEKVLQQRTADAARDALGILAETDPTRPTSPSSLPAVDPAVVRPVARDALVAAAGTATPKTGSNAPPEVPLAIASVIVRLDKKGVIDILIDELPENDRYGDTYLPMMRLVLAAREPMTNMARATRLLSYGLFDWAVTDSETRFAYLLVRSTPIPSQDDWRRVESGKWLHRLEDNVPDEMFTTGEYTGVGSEFVSGGRELGMPAAMLQGYADTLLDRWQLARLPIIAQNLVRELLGKSHAGEPQPWLKDANGAPASNDVLLRTAIIRRLDARLMLDEIIAKLPDDFLFGEMGRKELLELNQLRDPVHLMQQARDLIPKGSFGRLFLTPSLIFAGGITFTHRDAWLAAHAILAMGPADRQRFTAENPDLWTTLDNALTAEMRRDLPSTLASANDERLPTPEAIRTRLQDQRLWTEASALRLRALIDLALTADDRKFVFDTSRTLRIDQRAQGNPLLTAIKDDFLLYDEHAEPKRMNFDPQRTPSSRAPVWWSGLGVVARALGILLWDDFVENSISLVGKTMHLRGFPINDLQTIAGGDLGGVRLAKAPGGNPVNVDVTFESGFIVNIDLPELRIQGINIVNPTRTIRTGAVTLTGLKATAGFSDRGYHDPAYIGLRLGSLDVHDMVLVDPETLPFSGAWAVAQLGMNQLAFRATADGAMDPMMKIGQPLPTGWIGIPIFGPLVQLLMNLVSIKGGIPFDYTLLDYALIPAKLPFGVSSLVSLAGNQLAPTPAPLTNLWGLASDGVLRPPYSAAQRISDSMGSLRAYNASFDSLTVRGISIGAGQQIGSLELTDVNLGIGQSLPAYFNTAINTMKAAQAKLTPDSQQYKDLDERIAALRAQQSAVSTSTQIERIRDKQKKDPQSLTPLETEMLRLSSDRADAEKRLEQLESKDRWNPGSLSADERSLLTELTTELRGDVGVTLEVGGLRLGPLTGSIESAGVQLKGIHATAKLPNTGALLPYAPGYLDDRSLAEQFKHGGPRVPTVAELAKSSSFSLSIDSAEVLATDPPQPAVILKADHLPRAVELQLQIAALPVIEGNAPIRERLNRALDVLVALERARVTAEHGVNDEVRRNAAQYVLELTDDARRLLGIEIGGVKFGRITGELDPTTGTIVATVHDAELTNIAGPSFAVEKAKGSLELSLGLGGVNLRPDQVGKSSGLDLVGNVTPSVGLRDVEVTGVSLPFGRIGSVSLGHLTGTVRRTPTGLEIPDLVLDHLEVDSIDVGLGGAGITAEKAYLDRVGMDVAIDVSASAKGNELSRVVVRTLSIGAIGGSHIVADLPDVAGGVRAELLGGELRNVAVADLDVQKGAAGWEVLSAGVAAGSVDNLRYSVALGALHNRTTVKGTLSTSPTGRKGGDPSISVGFAQSPGGRKFALNLSISELQALGTEISTPDGSVVIRRVTIAGKYDATEAGASANATLADLVIGAVDWRVGSARVRGGGPITAKRVTVAAVSTPDTPATKNAPARKGGWSVTDIVMTSVAADDLRYVDAPIDIHLGRKAPTKPGEPPLTVGRVHIQPREKSLELKDLSVDFGGDVRAALQVDGHLAMDSLRLDLHRDDRLVAVVKGVSASVAVSGDYTGTVEVKGLQGATIESGPEGIKVGSDDPDDPGGVKIDLVSLTSLDLRTVVKGHKVVLTTQKDGRVDLVDMRLKVRIDKWKPDEPHSSKSPWKQAAIERLYIDKVNFGGLQLDLPDDDMTIVIPARSSADSPTLHGLDLRGGVGADGMYNPDFLIDLDTFNVVGGFSLLDIALPISARIKDKFNGDVKLTTQAANVDFLSAGGVKVDIEHPQLAMAKEAELGKDKRIRIAKFAAERLKLDDGRLFVQQPSIDDLEYTQNIGDARAIWLKLKHADMPEIDHSTFGNSGSLYIPSLDIKEAFFSLNLAALRNAGKAQGGSVVEPPSTFNVEQLRPLGDAVDGTIDVALFVSAPAGGLKDFAIGTEAKPLQVPIVKGAVDIPTFEHNLQGKVKATQIESGFYLRPWVLNTAADDPILRLDGPQLQLGVYGIDPPNVSKGNDPQGMNRPNTVTWKKILAWDLRPLDLTSAKANRFALWSAIFDMHSDSVSTDPDKAEEEKKESKAKLDSLEVRKLVANLSILNAAPLPIRLNTGTVRGSVTLSNKTALGLHIEGGIPAVSPPVERPGTNPGELSIGLDSFDVDGVDLTIFDDPVKPTSLQQFLTGSIHVEKLHDATLTFSDMYQPLVFKGTIDRAKANNIRWYH